MTCTKTSIFIMVQPMSEPWENFLFRTLLESLLDAFWGPYFGKAPGPHFDDLGSLLGFLLETILGTFGVLFLHRFSEGVQDSPKVKVGLEVKAIRWYLGSSNRSKSTR